MTEEGKPTMEKIIGEEDIKGLEAEIDSAVDRLFVEKKGNVMEKPLMKQPISEPSHEPLNASLQENSFNPSAESLKISLQEVLSKPPAEPPKAPLREDSFKPSSEPLPLTKSFEKVETQLLSLEWEITKENLQKTMEEVHTLQESLKERADISSVLNLMAKVLTHMIRNEEHIDPPQIKFLLDSKETLKLLMKKETGSEWNTYKQLLLGGIEARFLCMDGLGEASEQQPSFRGKEEKDELKMNKLWEQKIEERLNSIELSIGKVEKLLEKSFQNLCRLGQLSQISPEVFGKKNLSRLGIIILKTGGNLFGVESEKAFKLFKVPNAAKNKISSRQRIRLKDLEIEMVDLNKIFIVKDEDPTGDVQILTVKEDEKYRGLMVDQVLHKFSTEAEISGDFGESFLGKIRWTYQEKPMEIPILNLKRV